MKLEPVQPGSVAPAISGVDFSDGPTVLFFYKVTCPACQMAAPPASSFQRAYPGRIQGIGQDPEEKLAEFDRTYGLGFPSVADIPPYDLSNAYGIRTVPTTFLVDTGSSIHDLRAQRRPAAFPPRLKLQERALVWRASGRGEIHGVRRAH